MNAKHKVLESYHQKMQREHSAMQQVQYSHKTSLTAHKEREKNIASFRKALKKQK